MTKKASFWYKCSVCGRRFPIFWVSRHEWNEGGYEKKAVCKQCFEFKVPNPKYYTVDEYLDDIDDRGDIIRKCCPDLTPRQVSQRARYLRSKLKAELIKIWDLGAEW